MPGVRGISLAPSCGPHLNTLHNTYSRLTARDIWISNVSNVCQDIKIGCQAFEGIIESTMSRGDLWSF